MIFLREEQTSNTRYPDPQHRKGDCDFWVALTDYGLEYGYRIRAFYGEIIVWYPEIGIFIHYEDYRDPYAVYM